MGPGLCGESAAGFGNAGPATPQRLLPEARWAVLSGAAIIAKGRQNRRSKRGKIHHCLTPSGCRFNDLFVAPLRRSVTIRTARGNAAPTRTATAWFVSTFPRARIYRSAAKNSSMRLPMKSKAGPEKASGYDHCWRSALSYSSTTRSTQSSFINYSGVVLYF